MKSEYLHLIKHISQFISVSSSEIETITNAFEITNVKKNIILEKENQLTNYLYFINNGFLRVFYVNDGEERTTQINCPSKFITSFESFINTTKAYDNVETITNCQLLRINKQNLDELNYKVKNWRIFTEKIYEQALMFNEERTRDMILLNAEQRYKKLIALQNDIAKNVPIQYIASYIGIKPESLSRIRKKIIS